MKWYVSLLDSDIGEHNCELGPYDTEDEAFAHAAVHHGTGFLVTVFSAPRIPRIGSEGYEQT